MATRVLPARVLSPAGDLTDSYADVVSVQSTSPLRTRHGRGDTPLSVRPTSSLSSASATSSRRAPLPSLDKLIAFLDDDDDGGGEPTAASTPLRPPSSQSPPPAPLHTHSRSVRLSPAPALELVPPDDSTRETVVTASEQSPSARTEQSRRERSFREEETVGRAKGKGVEARLEITTPPTPTEHARPPSPADSDSRIADEVLNEFDSIISRHSSPPSRPRSRLRHIPSPPLSSSPTTPSPPLPTQRHLPTSSEYEPEAANEEQEDDTRTKAWVDRHPSHASSPPEPQGTLIDELREAKAYIAQLHAELRDIAGVVGSLRGPPVGVPVSRSTAAQSFAPLPPTLRPDETQAAFSVAQHLISVLPTPIPHPLTAVPLDSLALALQFTRDVDHLVHDGQEGRSRKDDEIFQQENLDRVRKRLGGWERVVRGRGDG